jgi:hypothetical protein
MSNSGRAIERLAEIEGAVLICGRSSPLPQEIAGEADVLPAERMGEPCALYLILQNRISRGFGSPEITLHRRGR